MKIITFPANRNWDTCVTAASGAQVCYLVDMTLKAANPCDDRTISADTAVTDLQLVVRRISAIQ